MARTAGSTGEKTAYAIRRAAVRLFAARGYAAVSMRALAEDVGIQVGALYNYFATKQDVLATVMLEHMEGLIADWERERGVHKTPAEALEGFTRFHVRYHIDRYADVFISFMELRSLDEENFAQVEALRRRYEHDLRDILIWGARAGGFQVEDAHVSAMALISMLTGVTNWFDAKGRLSAEAIEEIYVRLVRQAVGLDAPSPHAQDIGKAV